MSLLIQKSDFIGTVAVPQNAYTNIDPYITRYEEKYLKDLLGLDLFTLFKADVSSYIPVSPIYKAIYDPIDIEVNLCFGDKQIWHSDGMKLMIQGFVKWEYDREAKFKNTISGAKVNQSEISRESTFDESNIYGVYNLAIASYRTIQEYIRQNIEDYPKFSGVCKSISHWSL